MIVPFVESPPENIRVLLVSRFPDVLEADRKALATDRRITIIGCAGTPDDALDMVRLQPPDVILSGAYFDNSVIVGTGNDFARSIRSLRGLPFQPCFTILTSLKQPLLADFMRETDADFCFSRDFHQNGKDFICLIHSLYQQARRKNGGRITELRGDNATQKSHWVRAALRIKIREDGILAEVIDDWDFDKDCFIELMAQTIERGGPARCGIEDSISEAALKFRIAPRRITKNALAYAKKAAADARRRRSELSQTNPFLMDNKHDVKLEPIIAYYSRVFLEGES